MVACSLCPLILAGDWLARIPKLSLNDWAAIAQVAGTLVATVGLAYAGGQLRKSHKDTHGQFLLQLDEHFSQHNGTHVRFFKGGDWFDGTSGPRTPEEWAAVARYLGLFERVNLLVKQRILDIPTVYRLYGYRLGYLLGNPAIHGMVCKYPKDWQDLHELWKALLKYQKKAKNDLLTTTPTSPPELPKHADGQARAGAHAALMETAVNEPAKEVPAKEAPAKKALAKKAPTPDKQEIKAGG